MRLFDHPAICCPMTTSMRITQHHSFLVDLLKHVRQGHLVPAAFQRPYVWSAQDVEALCDSVLSGFPLGGFLVWSPPPTMERTTIAGSRLGPIPMRQEPVDAGHTTVRPIDLLLDGQNRLASFAWMAADASTLDEARSLSLSDAERTTWCSGRTLTADALTRTIRFMTDDEACATLSLPARMVVFPQAMAMNRAIRERDQGWQQRFGKTVVDDALQWFDNAAQAFREARVTHTVLDNATPEEARHAFLRICKVGVPMSPEDFDRAIGWILPTPKRSRSPR